VFFSPVNSKLFNRSIAVLHVLVNNAGATWGEDVEGHPVSTKST